MYKIAFSFMTFHDEETIATNSTQNDLAIELTFLSWLSISVFIGGFVSRLVSKKKDIVNIVLISSILIFILYLIDYINFIKNGPLKCIIAIILSCYLGSLIGIKIRRIRNSDNSSSPPDTPSQ
jgi:hypothetical protein